MLSKKERQFIDLYINNRKKWEMEYTDIQRRQFRHTIWKKYRQMEEDTKLIMELMLGGGLQSTYRPRKIKL